jgi:hypothetical protein
MDAVMPFPVLKRHRDREKSKAYRRRKKESTVTPTVTVDTVTIAGLAGRLAARGDADAQLASQLLMSLVTLLPRDGSLSLPESCPYLGLTAQKDTQIQPKIANSASEESLINTGICASQPNIQNPGIRIQGSQGAGTGRGITTSRIRGLRAVACEPGSDGLLIDFKARHCARREDRARQKSGRSRSYRMSRASHRVIGGGRCRIDNDVIDISTARRIRGDDCASDGRRTKQNPERPSLALHSISPSIGIFSSE